MVQYTAKFARDRYRLGRVLRIVDSRDGLVRTVRVGMRNQRRGAREALTENKAGLTEVELLVQRLVLILPGADQPQEIVDKLRDQPNVRATPVVPQPGASDPVVPRPGGVEVSWQDAGGDEIIDV